MSREKTLVERSLEAEQKLAEAMRKVGLPWLFAAVTQGDGLLPAAVPSSWLWEAGCRP